MFSKIDKNIVKYFIAPFCIILQAWATKCISGSKITTFIDITIMANQTPSTARKRPPNFRLEIPGDDIVKSRIQEKILEVKTKLTAKLNKPVNNGIIIEELLDLWLKKGPDFDGQSHTFPSTYVQVQQRDVDQRLFITAEKSITTYGEIFEAHTSICKGKLKVTKMTMKGHVASLRLTCSLHKSHSYLWSSSPYLPNDEYLVNHRVSHGFFSSGLLPVHYTRFVNAAELDVLQKKIGQNFSNDTNSMLKTNV